MSNIKPGPDRIQGGKVAYNANIIEGIVAISVGEVEGVARLSGKSGGIFLRHDKESVYVAVTVVAKFGYDIPELAYRVQQSVIHGIENMTFFKVAKVDVHVADVEFAAPMVKGEKEEKDEASETDESEEN
jgi:uncharacterized alkaline shock family protein YloU